MEPEVSSGALLGDLDGLGSVNPVLNSLINTQDQLDEVIRWLHEHKLLKTVDCLVDEFYSKEVKTEVVVPSYPINKLSSSHTQEATILSVKKHPSKNWIVTTDSRKNLIVSNNHGEMISSIVENRENNPFLGSIIATDFHPTLDLLLIGTMCESHAILKIGEIKEKEVKVATVKTFKVHQKYVVRVKWNHSGTMFATASHDKTVCVYSFNNENFEANLVKQLYFSGAAEAIQFTLDDSTLIVATRDDSNLHYINLEDWSKKLITMNTLGDSHVSFTPLDIILSNDGKSLLVSTDISMSILFRTGSPYQIRRFFGFKNDGMSQPRAAFDKNNFLYITSQDNTIFVFDLEREMNISSLVGHKGIVRDIAYDEVNDELISVSYDKSIKFWKREYGI